MKREIEAQGELVMQALDERKKRIERAARRAEAKGIDVTYRELEGGSVICIIDGWFENIDSLPAMVEAEIARRAAA